MCVSHTNLSLFFAIMRPAITERYKAYYFTLWGYSAYERDGMWGNRKTTYLTMQEFTSVMGTKHLQGFMILRYEKTMSELRWLTPCFERCSFEPSDPKLDFYAVFSEYAERVIEKGQQTEKDEVTPYFKMVIKEFREKASIVLGGWQKEALRLMDAIDPDTILFVIHREKESEERTEFANYVEKMRSGRYLDTPFHQDDTLALYGGEKYVAVDIPPEDTALFNYSILCKLKDKQANVVVLLAGEPNDLFMEAYMGPEDYRCRLVEVTDGGTTVRKMRDVPDWDEEDNIDAE